MAALVINLTLGLAALVAWSFAAGAADVTIRGWLFLLAVAAVFAALRRYVWLALVVAGVMAMAMNQPRVRTLDEWNAIFLLCAPIGTAMSLRRWPEVRWIAASWPFWVMADAAEWSVFVALSLTIGGMAVAAVGPTLPGRRRARVGPPLPQLAAGPLVAIEPRTFAASRRSRVIDIGIALFAVLAIVLFAWSGRAGDPALLGALALSAAIIAATFAFANWFAGRVRLRIDAAGLHSRTLVREHTLPWPDTVTIYLRYVFIPGTGMRIVYYCVRSTTREFAFPSSMPGAGALKAAIEQATGLTFPAPTITANF